MAGETMGDELDAYARKSAQDRHSGHSIPRSTPNYRTPRLHNDVAISARMHLLQAAMLSFP